METGSIPFKFNGTGRVGNRFFRGEATFCDDKDKLIISGSMLRGSGKSFLRFYWFCGLVIFLGTLYMLILLETYLLVSTGNLESLIRADFWEEPGLYILNMVVVVLITVGGVYASILFCRFVLRKNGSVELPRKDVSAILKGSLKETGYLDIQIRMKDSRPAINLYLTNKHVSKLSDIFGVRIARL